MKIEYRVLDAPKAGNQRVDMEDAAYPRQTVVTTLANGFACAVSDGATQGSHSGPWARFLCEELARVGDAINESDILERIVPVARQGFQAWEAQYLADRAAQGRPLAWFEEAVIGSGAFATLVGLSLTAAPESTAPEGVPSPATARFHAVAVGDSCLFVVRGGRLAQSFPLEDSAQFAGAPLLIASQAASNGQMAGATKHLDGELAVGDGLFLCSDAMAAWMLREKEHGSDPTARLVAVLAGNDQAAFDEFLTSLRQAKQLRNDDVVLAHIQVVE